MSRADLKLEYTADHEKITVAAKGSQVILAVLWTDLASVCVITTSGGPFTEDCFIEVTSAKGNSFEIPNSKLHGSFLFDRLSRLPGFDHIRFTDAMGVAVEDRVEVWKRKDQTDDEILQAVSDQNILPTQPDGMAIPEPSRFFSDLRQAYDDSRRHYHNWMHIEECLKEFWSVESWNYPKEVWCAILFHDVIYVAGRKDNEERSAAYAIEALAGLKVDRAKVKELILLTAQHHRVDQFSALDDDAKRFLDIDRSILGSVPVRYRLYAMGVQLEYTERYGRWRYLFGRARFLHSLLRQPRIFLTGEFETRLGQRARENLEDEWRSIPFLVRLVTSCRAARH